MVVSHFQDKCELNGRVVSQCMVHYSHTPLRPPSCEASSDACLEEQAGRFLGALSLKIGSSRACVVVVVVFWWWYESGPKKRYCCAT